MTSGFRVPPEALQQLDRGLSEATDGLAGLLPGIGGVTAGSGAGLAFELRQTDGQVLGHERLGAALARFGDTTDPLLHELLAARDDTQQQVRRALETYERTDGQIEDELRAIEQAVTGRGEGEAG